jgi:hypothetical protein
MTFVKPTAMAILLPPAPPAQVGQRPGCDIIGGCCERLGQFPLGMGNLESLFQGFYFHRVALYQASTSAYVSDQSRRDSWHSRQ